MLYSIIKTDFRCSFFVLWVVDTMAGENNEKKALLSYHGDNCVNKFHTKDISCCDSEDCDTS